MSETGQSATKSGKPEMSEIDVREISQCSCLRLRRITRRITHIYDQLLEPAGLTINQFGLLGRLYGASQRGELLAIGILAERVGMDPTTLNRSLKPLEKAGLIANTGDRDDRRVRAVTITEAGKDKLRAAMPYWRQAQTQIDISLGLDATVALNGLLELSYQKLAQALLG
jgi:DNA-binding MarR family transcriptional regulator